MILMAATPARSAVVTTLSGTGQPGFADGPAAQASFVMPAGLAFDATTKSLFIADAGAQRIRVLAEGRVSTLSGSGTLDERALRVPGGYRDGPVAEALFNTPMAVAIDEHRRLYVADTGNHCIRKIENGIVSTVAHFSHPMGVAVDKAGNVYVADPVDGLKQIRPSGEISTIPQAHAPLSVAVREGAGGVTLIVSDIEGVLVTSQGGQNERYRAFQKIPQGVSARFEHPELVHNVQGYKDIGFPFAVSVFGPASFVYTDVRSSAVSFMDERVSRLEPLGGEYAESTMADTAAFQDGSAPQARFDAPMGIAVTDKSEVIVADSGNRRLRLIKNVDPRDAVFPPVDLLPSVPFPATDYKIAFMGNSFIWYNNRWNDSIQGIAEKRLAIASPHRRIRVVPVGASGAVFAAFSYVRSTNGYYNMIVYNVNFYNACYSCQPGDKANRNDPKVWSKPFADELRDFKRYLDSQAIPLLVVIHPLPDESSPIESAQTNLLLQTIEPDASELRALHEAVVSSGAHFIDLTSAFEQDFRSPRHLPLFGTEDPHFATHAREIVATAVAAEIQRMLQMQSRPKARRKS